MTNSNSRRRIQGRDQRRGVIRQANLLVQALNSLYFNYPTTDFTRTLFPCSYSSAQGRLLINVHKLSLFYYSLCRGPSQMHRGHFLSFILSNVNTDTLCLCPLSRSITSTDHAPLIDNLQYTSFPHLMSPMIYGPSPSIVPIRFDRISLPDSLNNLSILSLLPATVRVSLSFGRFWSYLVRTRSF